MSRLKGADLGIVSNAPSSTTGFGLPSVSGRNEGDLHYDRLSTREFILVSGGWVPSAGPTSAVGSGLPSFAGRVAGDLAYDTTAKRQYVLTGTAGGSAGDDFNVADRALAGKAASNGNTWGLHSTKVVNGTTDTTQTQIVGNIVSSNISNFGGSDVLVGAFGQGGSVQVNLKSKPEPDNTGYIDVGLGFATATGAGLFFRTLMTSTRFYSEGSGTTEIRYSDSSGATTVLATTGNNTVVADASMRTDRFTSWELRLSGTGAVSVIREGVVLLTATLSGAQMASLGSYAGFKDAYNTFLDDFAAVATGTLAWSLTSPIQEAVNTVAASGAAQTLPDVSTATMHKVTLTANCTITLPTPGAGKSLTVELVQDATGGRTVTWATPSGAIRWPGGTAPTISPAAGAIDVISFISVGGTNWYGFVGGQAFA